MFAVGRRWLFAAVEWNRQQLLFWQKVLRKCDSDVSQESQRMTSGLLSGTHLFNDGGGELAE